MAEKLRCPVCHRPTGKHAPAITERRGDDLLTFCSEPCRQDYRVNPERYRSAEEEE